MARSERRGGYLWRGLGSLVCSLLVLYGFPVRTSHVFDRNLILLLLAGTAGLIWLVVVQIRRMLVPQSKHSGRLAGVLSLVFIATSFFALAYYLIEVNAPAQFDGLTTRTDALYYAVVTLGTVGYGDIHAVGQLARVATMVQVLFDLVAIGALLTVASSSLADRLNRGERQ